MCLGTRGGIRGGELGCTAGLSMAAAWRERGRKGKGGKRRRKKGVRWQLTCGAHSPAAQVRDEVGDGLAVCRWATHGLKGAAG
jgi:hypothetical protein